MRQCDGSFVAAGTNSCVHTLMTAKCEAMTFLEGGPILHFFLNRLNFINEQFPIQEV
jgi:hypothetical protein